jgi:glutamate synthase (NADPH) small chain
MEQQDLRELENRCIQECTAPCTARCPVHVDVKAMVAATCAGDFVGAVSVFQKKVPFPGIISLVCDHPCQDACRRTAIGATVSIKSLERASLNHGSPTKSSITPLPGKGNKVAIVGAGLSGLTAALELTKKGHKIVLFEASYSLGGSVWDHPKTSLPRKVIQKDFDIVRDSPIRIRYGTVLGRDFTLSDLEEDYDAVYLGIGAGFTWSEQIEKDESGRVKADLITFQTGRPGVFASGSLLSDTGRRSSIRSISDGQKAAISIDRYLQGVSFSASQEHEGPCDARLFTTVAGKEPRPLLD